MTICCDCLGDFNVGVRCQRCQAKFWGRVEDPFWQKLLDDLVNLGRKLDFREVTVVVSLVDDELDVPPSTSCTDRDYRNGDI